MSAGAVVWFTGLPGAGKSTLARALEGALRARGRHVELLDGDEIREHLWRDLGFSKEDRDEHIRRMGYVARLLARNGVVAIVAAVSPYRAARDAAREGIERFVEVYLECPVEELARRDPKHLWERAQRGDLPGFTGVSGPYEPPLRPELRIDTSSASVDDALRAVLRALDGPAAVAAPAR